MKTYQILALALGLLSGIDAVPVADSGQSLGCPYTDGKRWDLAI
jgi:hypothetical protein